MNVIEYALHERADLLRHLTKPKDEPTELIAEEGHCVCGTSLHRCPRCSGRRCYECDPEGATPCEELP